MELLYKQKHLTCFNDDNGENPTIEVVKTVKGEEKSKKLTTNQIVFILEGRIQVNFKESPSCEVLKGQILFMPTGTRYSYRVLAQAMLVIFRVNHPVLLCDNYPVEKLYNAKEAKPVSDYEQETKQFGRLEINPKVWHFLDGIVECISDGLKCRCWFEMKIKEFFLLLRAYYPKENIHDFLFLVLSRDAAFAEYIHRNWQKFSSVAGLAASLNMTPKYFSTRFVPIFGQPPSRWISRGKAHIISREIISTKKQFKQIAFENGFSSDTLFTRFCKKELGKTPTQIRMDNQEND